MNNSPLPDRRRLHYVDHILQKWLLVALVALETMLTAAAIWGLYRVLADIVDENMYRIHFSGNDDGLRTFLSAGANILAGVSVVNVLAIIAADRIWALYVRNVLRTLEKIVDAARRLDFTSQHVKPAHAVLDQALQWHVAESSRVRGLRLVIGQLPNQLPQTPGERAALAARLRTIAGSGRSAQGGSA